MRKAFFDRQRVIDAVDRQTRKALSKSLAYIRTGIRSGYRRRKSVSRPGQSPTVHATGIVSLRTVLFAYDERTKSGIVGPVKLNGQKSIHIPSKPVPGLLEEGGTMRVLEERRWGTKTWFRQTHKSKKRKDMQRRQRRVIVLPRPNVAPALEKEIAKGNVSSPWANVITG